MKPLVTFFLPARASVVGLLSALLLCCQVACTKSDAGTTKTIESPEIEAALAEPLEKSGNAGAKGKDETLPDVDDDLSTSLDKEIDKDPISEKEIDLDEKEEVIDIDTDVAENPRNNPSSTSDPDDETDEDL